jgi:hypothetical protein
MITRSNRSEHKREEGEKKQQKADMGGKVTVK